MKTSLSVIMLFLYGTGAVFSDVHVDVGFENRNTGEYTAAMAREDFPNVKWVGLDQDETVAPDPQGDGMVFKKVYRVRPDFDTDANEFTKALIFSELPPADSMYLAYDVLFSQEFVDSCGDEGGASGGKLPGLAGGSSWNPVSGQLLAGSPPAGGYLPYLPANTDSAIGWSVRTYFNNCDWISGGTCTRQARIMQTFINWMNNPNTPNSQGRIFERNFDMYRPYRAGVWYRFVLFVKMNTPGQNNGIVRMWVNKPVSDDADTTMTFQGEGFRFRTDASLKVDEFWFTTFFGGRDGPDRECTAWFDNIRVFGEAADDDFYTSHACTTGRDTCGPAGDGVFTGCYFNDVLFEDLAFSRTDSVIDFNWEYDAPASGMVVDSYAVSWRGTFAFEDGEYEFFTTVDDGIRILVDGDTVINKWFRQVPTTYTETESMTAGPHLVEVEYFEAVNTARVKVGWGKASGVSLTDRQHAPGACANPVRADAVSTLLRQQEGRLFFPDGRGVPAGPVPGGVYLLQQGGRFSRILVVE